MILKIYSENGLLADILHKNPETDEGLYVKPLKSGTIVGNIVSAHQYDVMFCDRGNSYTDETGNQLDFQSLCNPLLILNVSTELFGHILKERTEYMAQEIKWRDMTRGEADTERCVIEVPVFYINSGWYRDGVFLLEKYFDGISLESSIGSNFKLRITGNTVFETVNLLNLTALFTHLTNTDAINTFIDDHFASKYLRVLTNIEGVPYFVLYLFVKKALKSSDQFGIVKPVLEDYLAEYGIKAELKNEDTQRSRIRFITDAIGTDLSVLDVGCGEFAYYKKLLNRGLRKNYYAVDRDPNYRRLGESIMQRMDADNLSFHGSLETVPTDERVNVILSEVIEHNEPQKAVELVKAVLEFDFEKVVISTPNAAFNQFYFNKGFRHDDHHFEFTQEEFTGFMETCIAGREDLYVEYTQVGDELNGICPTQIAVIEKYDKKIRR